MTRGKWKKSHDSDGSGSDSDSSPSKSSQDANICKKNRQYRLDWKLLTRVKDVIKLIYPNVGSPAIVPLILFLAAEIVNEIVKYYSGLIPSNFIKVMVEGDVDGFKSLFAANILLVIFRALTFSFRVYFRSILSATWYRTLTKRIHRKYFRGINYYKMNVTDRRLDNPDRRICDDAEQFVESICEVLIEVIIQPFVIFAYSYEAYKFMGFKGVAVTYVVMAIFIYFNFKVLAPIIKGKTELERREGDYRHQHTRIRTYSESIAMQASANLEENITNSKLDDVVEGQRKVSFAFCNAEIFLRLFIYSKNILSFAILSIPFLAGEFAGLSPGDLGRRITEYSFVIGNLVDMFIDLIDNTKELTEMAGSTHRVSELVEELDRMNGQVELTDVADKTEDKTFLEVKNVSIYPPFCDDVTKPIIRNLNLRVNANQNLLICGRGSCGKTSILRIVRGLWPVTDGIISRSDVVKNQSFYLPQKPLLTEGSLRNQITYPNVDEHRYSGDGQVGNKSDISLINYVKKLKLEDLLNRTGGLDEYLDWNWYDVLSPSEAHRLCFIRLFYHRPKIAFLDDALNLIRDDVVEFIFDECDRIGITLVTVGDKESLRKYHRRLIELKEDGFWKSFETVRGSSSDL